MYKVSLEVTNSCNLNCTYCYLGEKKIKNMSFETAMTAIDMAVHEAKKQYDKTLLVYFIGGEPLLAFDMMKKVVEYVKQQCKDEGLKTKYTLTTNGTLLNEEIIDFFISEEFDIKLSLDGTKEAHDSYRKDYNGIGSYDKIRSKFSLLSKYEMSLKRPVAAVHVVTTDNVSNWSENFKHVASFGFKYMNNDFNSYDEWTDEELQILKDEHEKLLYWYFLEVRPQKRLYWKNVEEYIKNMKDDKKSPFLRCGAGVCSVFVNVDGVYYHCQEIENDKRIGSVREGLDVPEIRKYSSIKETENKDCLSCSYLNRCFAKRCVIENYIHHKDIFKPILVKCYVTKIINQFIDQYLDPDTLEIIDYEGSRRNAEKYADV